jgi:hypothetical protein
MSATSGFKCCVDECQKPVSFYCPSCNAHFCDEHNLAFHASSPIQMIRNHQREPVQSLQNVCGVLTSITPDLPFHAILCPSDLLTIRPYDALRKGFDELHYVLRYLVADHLLQHKTMCFSHLDLISKPSKLTLVSFYNDRDKDAYLSRLRKMQLEQLQKKSIKIALKDVKFVDSLDDFFDTSGKKQTCEGAKDCDKLLRHFVFARTEKVGVGGKPYYPQFYSEKVRLVATDLFRLRNSLVHRGFIATGGES